MLSLITAFSSRSLTRTCEADAVITYSEAPSNGTPYTTSVDATVFEETDIHLSRHRGRLVAKLAGHQYEVCSSLMH
jgi:hypothetical protein